MVWWKCNLELCKFEIGSCDQMNTLTMFSVKLFILLNLSCFFTKVLLNDFTNSVRVETFFNENVCTGA